MGIGKEYWCFDLRTPNEPGNLRTECRSWMTWLGKRILVLTLQTQSLLNPIRLISLIAFEAPVRFLHKPMNFGLSMGISTSLAKIRTICPTNPAKAYQKVQFGIKTQLLGHYMVYNQHKLQRSYWVTCFLFNFIVFTGNSAFAFHICFDTSLIQILKKGSCRKYKI